VADCGARAATEATDHRLLGSDDSRGSEAVGRCFPPEAERTRLDQGRTVATEYRWGEGLSERTAEVAAELVQSRVDIILAGGTEPAVAAKKATTVIPIVFGLAGDPVGIGLVASLARPGGNVTGLSTQGSDLAGKRLEILRQLIPTSHRLAILANPEYPGLKTEMSEIQAAARKLGLNVTMSEIRQAQDIAPAFDTFSGRVDAIYAVGDPLLNSLRVRICTLALHARLPKREALCPMDQTSQACFGAPQIMSTKSCAAPNRASFRSSNPPSLISISISRQPRRSV
jgi:putative ABC transport system substrate-binding protein